MKQLPVKDAVPFIPYGLMDEDFLQPVRTGEEVPPDWDPDDPKRKTNFQTWFKDTLHLIANHLWPVYVTSKSPGAWEGEAADLRTMEELTRADLELLLRIREMNLLDMQPNSLLKDPDIPTHREWFRQEDGSNAFMAQHRLYDQTADEKLVRVMRTTYLRDHFSKEMGTIGTRFKERLQRPRPFQMALYFGIHQFTHESALSSLSPSCSSGHALQGLTAVGGVIESLLLKGIHLSQDSWNAIEQYAVDIGDRRVFAGIHYPSDNLASWIILLRLAPHVYRSLEVRERLWHAISTRSKVYELIESSGETVYSPALELLKSLASPAKAAGV
jgi:hypothetical protein